jgi:hypothetical protein
MFRILRSRPGLHARGVLLLLPVLLAATALLPAAVRADEGMWTFDDLPLRQLQERYGFAPDPGWVEHLQRAAINFGGGSGAFVSPDGLALTNHHVALGQLAKLSSPGHDYVRDGFFARSRAEELPCPDLELKVLVSSTEVTARVLGAVDSTAADREQGLQRRAAVARIEQEASGGGLRGEIVELFHGGEYWLYVYKTYKDVRLVCAPEEQAAFFGGDLDNFCYPRHDLDFAFFRVYEDGQPVRPQHWFRWSREGAREGDLVFVVGNPGSTRRQNTVVQLEDERGLDLPLRIRFAEQRLAAWRDYAARGPEQARQTRDRIRGLENNLKRQRAFLEVLSAPGVMQARRDAEADLRQRIGSSQAASRLAILTWERIAGAMKESARRHREYVARDFGRSSRLFDLANGLVRYTAEVGKPNEQRFKEYRDAKLESERFRLFSRAPIYPEMEEMILGVLLQQCLDELGPGDPFVQVALGGRGPQEVARALVAGTKLGDPAVRKALVAGGPRAVAASKDPLLVWARKLDAPYRELRAWHENEVENVESLDGGRIAQARFLLEGHALSPDATGSLRLSYGKVAGYPQLSTVVPWVTTFHGLFDRSLSFGGAPPFDLPARFTARERDLDLATPLDFVCTADIIGGNSGSAVLNRRGEYVGLVFDGNVQSFAWDYYYTDEQARCVAVDSRGLIEALRKVYDMGALADEVEGKQP